MSHFTQVALKMRVKFNSRFKWNGKSLVLSLFTIINVFCFISLKILKWVSLNVKPYFKCQPCRVHLCLLWHSVARKMTWHARELLWYCFPHICFSFLFLFQPHHSLATVNQIPIFSPHLKKSLSCPMHFYMQVLCNVYISRFLA